MGTAKATKAADKAQVCRKLVNALHKLYGRSVPKIELSVVETFLFAVCLEDNQWAPAEAGLKKLLSAFFDLNEVRVSSVTELEQQLAPLRFADWKGMRIRSILRHIFETTYSYDFEKLRRQTMEQALKTLKKFHDVTPFIRDFILHEILGSHVVVLDTSMLNAARWLGLVSWTSDHDSAAEFLKGGIKKSEVSEFCHLLRCLATDPKFIPRFTDPPDHELSMHDVMDRFVELQNPPKRKAKPAPPPEPPKVEKPVTDKKPAASASSARPTVPSGKVASAPVGKDQKGTAVKSIPASTKPAPGGVKQGPHVAAPKSVQPAATPSTSKPHPKPAVSIEKGKSAAAATSSNLRKKPVRKDSAKPGSSGKSLTKKSTKKR